MKHLDGQNSLVGKMSVQGPSKGDDVEMSDARHTSDDSLTSGQPAGENIPNGRQNTKPTTGPPSAPNGGVVAWTQCANTFCLWFAAWGLVNSFGATSSAKLKSVYVQADPIMQESSKHTTRRPLCANRPPAVSHGSAPFSFAFLSSAPAL